MAEDKTPEIEFIDVVEEVLDNQAFMLAIAGGVVIGVLAIIAYQEWRKTHPIGFPPSAEPEIVEPIQDNAENIEVIPQAQDTAPWAR